MAFRYFIQLSYNGKAYHGWQSQDNAISVQEVLNEKISLLLRESVNLQGAGRTDTGVHAEFFMAHFDLISEIKDKVRLINGLNKILPKDIAINNIFWVSNEHHARFSAISRTYEYRIVTKKDPFLSEFAWLYMVPLNLAKMNEAAQILFEYHDFTSFSKLGTQVATNNCKIHFAEWFWKGQILVFRIIADRFLRNMVRAIVGTIIEVGRDRLSVEDIRRIIEKKDRCSAGFSVPAKGLFLTNIEYPSGLIIK